jgi:hypothetical protein
VSKRPFAELIEDRRYVLGDGASGTRLELETPFGLDAATPTPPLGYSLVCVHAAVARGALESGGSTRTVVELRVQRCATSRR